MPARLLLRIEAAEAVFLQAQQWVGQVRRQQQQLQDASDSDCSVDPRVPLALLGPEQEQGRELAKVVEQVDFNQLAELRHKAGYKLSKRVFPPVTLGRGRTQTLGELMQRCFVGSCGRDCYSD